MTLHERTVRQKHEPRTDTLTDTLTETCSLSWCVLHTGGRCPGVFSTRVGDVLVCSPLGWAMSWCVLHTGGRYPGVFSARVGDVLVCSPHGWPMSWCVLHTGGRCPRRLHVAAVDIRIICCPPRRSAVVQTGHCLSQ